MKITILLQTDKGEAVDYFIADFEKIHCLSDAGQQLPKMIVQYNDSIFGFSRLAPEDSAIFKERKVLNARQYL